MKLIKDLGMLYPTLTSIQTKRYGMYECPICLKPFKTQTYRVKGNKIKHCIKCNSRPKTHADSHSKLYNVWQAMKSRCYNKNHTRFIDYGAKGTYVCDEWKDDFIAFKSWALNNGYKKGLTIDKDKMCYKLEVYPKLYSPETCIWISQAINNSYKHIYLYDENINKYV